MSSAGGLDRETGVLRLDGMTLEVGPGLTWVVFRAHPDAGAFTVAETGAHAASATATIGGVPFLVSLTFGGEALRGVRINAADPTIAGTSWNDYDPARVRGFHDGWLEGQLGRGGVTWNVGAYPLGGLEFEYGWGSAGSYLHPKDMGATIVIRYW